MPDSNGDDYVTRAECALTSGRIFEELTKHGLALYGEDGRGGIQHDISKMRTCLNSIEETLNNKKTTTILSSELSTRKLIAIVAAVAGILGPITLAIVQFLLTHIAR